MTGPAKRKGDRAELEVQAMLRDHLGVPARRALGAGRRDDVGDVVGVPNTVIQVCAYGRGDFAYAARVKPEQAEEQRVRAGVDHAATFMKLHGHGWRVVLTPEQYFVLWREGA